MCLIVQTNTLKNEKHSEAVKSRRRFYALVRPNIEKMDKCVSIFLPVSSRTPAGGIEESLERKPDHIDRMPRRSFEA